MAWPSKSLLQRPVVEKKENIMLKSPLCSVKGLPWLLSGEYYYRRGCSQVQPLGLSLATGVSEKFALQSIHTLSLCAEEYQRPSKVEVRPENVSVRGRGGRDGNDLPNNAILPSVNETLMMEDCQCTSTRMFKEAGSGLRDLAFRPPLTAVASSRNLPYKFLIIPVQGV